MPNQSSREELKRLLTERALRKLEGLYLYEPLESQASFHESRAKARVLRGSNRGGKTLPGAIELARAALGKDPYKKYPLKDGRAYIIGRSETHIGETIWPKLSRAGAFKIVKDPVTELWRAYRPWTDAGLPTKPAPPLIPPRMIVDGDWYSKKASIPKKIRLANGWEISFFSSLGKPPRGMDIDLAWFDEEIVDGEWYPEMRARLIDRGGRFYWSATPQSGTEQLLDLHELAAEQRHWEHPAVTEHFVHIDKNPHISAADKLEFAGTLNETDHEVRYEGGFLISTALIYPEWDTVLHGIKWFQIPRHWTRYVAVDPGRQTCACLFAAVPGPNDDEAGRVFLYDEIYIRNATARLFGDAMKQKAGGQEFYAFIIDKHGGKHTEAGMGLSYMEHYQRALKRAGVRSITTGHGFFLSSDNAFADTEAARALLIPRDDPDPRKCGPVLSVFLDKCPSFIREIRKYRYRRDRASGTIDDKHIPHKGDVHLMDCLRYLAAHGMHWARPSVGSSPEGGALAVLRAKREKAQQSGDPYVRLGSGGKP